MLGIGVTTYDRRERVLSTLDAIVRHTIVPYELIVCDDGSSDGTAEALREAGYTVVSGANRGVAWNKNRALFALYALRGCSTVVLLEDDTYPTRTGWEGPWIEAVTRHGHTNLCPRYLQHEVVSGAGRPDDPYLSRYLSGQCSAFSREALAFVGYMDTRFGRYGFEHVEHSIRVLRAGLGGTYGADLPDHRFFLLSDDEVEIAMEASSGRPEDIAHNSAVFEAVRHEAIYRPPWRTDDEMDVLRWEMSSIVSSPKDRFSRSSICCDHMDRANVRRSVAEVRDEFLRIDLSHTAQLTDHPDSQRRIRHLSTADLLALPDVDAFVTGAYWAVLRRAPDPSGWETYRNVLIAGTHSRLDVIGILRNSPEGLSLDDLVRV